MTTIASHMIQSTLFAAVAGLLTLAFRKNRAQIRYVLWLSASVKFLIPFSLLIAAGSHFGIRYTTVLTAAPALSSVIGQIAEPFTAPAAFPARQPAPILIAESPAPVAGPRLSESIPKFRSVSIKPCVRFNPWIPTGFLTSPPGTLNSSCTTLYTFIRTAYAATASPFISGGPIWISMAPYQINATAIGTPTEEIMRGPMLQALLESRFHLKIHRETKEIAMYALTVAPGGPKLQAVPDVNCAPVRSLRALFPMLPPPPPPPAPPASNCGTFSGNTPPGTPNELKASTVLANVADLDTIAEHLASVIGRPVINKTGLKGRFSFRIKFANDDTPARPPSPDTVFTVLEKQLGLKLEPTTGPHEFIYIDQAERP